MVHSHFLICFRGLLLLRGSFLSLAFCLSGHLTSPSGVQAFEPQIFSRLAPPSHTSLMLGGMNVLLNPCHCRVKCGFRGSFSLERNTKVLPLARPQGKGNTAASSGLLPYTTPLPSFSFCYLTRVPSSFIPSSKGAPHYPAFCCFIGQYIRP